MPRISINQMTTYRWSFLDDVTALQSLGVEGIGIWRRKLSEFGEERGIELLRESTLAVSSLWTAGGFTGSDGHTFEDAVEDALDALRLATEMKAGCLVVVSGGRASHTLSHARRLLREALRELGAAADRQGPSIALAAVPHRSHDRCSFLPSLDAALELLAECNHPRVGLALDFLRIWQEDRLCRRMAEIVPWVKIAALCDARAPGRGDEDRCVPGRGQLPLAEMISALESHGYRGMYDLHLLGQQCWSLDYGSVIQDSLDCLAVLSPKVFTRTPRPSTTGA